MALIRKITHVDMNSRLQKEVRGTYCIVPHGTGCLLTIHTYRRSEQNRNDPDQIIQFDLQGAKRLKELIEAAFPSLKQGASTPA